jgi:MAP/microtubule affinity-regulating kinase
MSPQLLKKDSFSPFKADIWALGVLLFRLVFGVLPFKAKTPEQILKKILNVGLRFPQTKKISGKLRDGIQRMLTVREKDRFSAEEVVQWFSLDVRSSKD